jgi:hypothetical protein
MRTILASASDLALATTQRSLTSHIFALTRPLTALLVAGGLPLAPSALASACLGAWVSLPAALLSQLSWFNITLLLVSIFLPILDKVWPVCATNVPPGSTDFSTSYHGGVADCSCTPGGTRLYDVHRSARRGAAKKKRKTRCAGHPCSEVETCERKGAESAVVEERENRKVSPVESEKTVNEPSPALAVPKGLTTLGTAIERGHDDIPGKGGDTGVMNQCVSHRFAEATRVASWTVSSLAHWLEACSLVNLRLSRNSRLEEEENSSLGKNAFLGKEEDIAEKTESDPEGAPCAHSCQCCRIPDSDSDDDEMPPLIGPDEINEGEAHVSPLFAVIASVAYILTHAVTMPCYALRCVAVRTFRLLCVPFVIGSSVVLLLFCLVRCLVVMCAALPRLITPTDPPSAPATEPEEGTLFAGEEPAAVKLSCADRAALAVNDPNSCRDADVDDASCDCVLCQYRRDLESVSPTPPADEAEATPTVSPETAGGAEGTPEETGTQVEPTPAEPKPKRVRTRPPTPMLPRRVRRLVRFAQSLPPLTRMQRLRLAVYEPLVRIVMRHELVVCNLTVWSLVAYICRHDCAVSRRRRSRFLTPSPMVLYICGIHFIPYLVQ